MHCRWLPSLEQLHRTASVAVIAAMLGFIAAVANAPDVAAVLHAVAGALITAVVLSMVCRYLLVRYTST